jgi:hypothetical protein
MQKKKLIHKSVTPSNYAIRQLKKRSYDLNKLSWDIVVLLEQKKVRNNSIKKLFD